MGNIIEKIIFPDPMKYPAEMLAAKIIRAMDNNELFCPLEEDDFRENYIGARHINPQTLLESSYFLKALGGREIVIKYHPFNSNGLSVKIDFLR